jgi:hypothetical protein
MVADMKVHHQAEEPDAMIPPDERQEALRQAYDANNAAGKTPYEEVEIRTLGELAWIMQERDWSGVTRAVDKARADLSNASLMGINLADVQLSDANLSGATLVGANLSGARLTGANLRGARLLGANLAGAVLTKADLSEANLRQASLLNARLANAQLSGASLLGANLASADLTGADLSGVDLRRARMDATTQLVDVTIDTQTKVADVLWNGVSLAQVDWEHAPHLGDEALVEATPNIRERALAFQVAARAYRGLGVILRDQGLSDVASRYRVRQHSMERHAFFAERNFGRWAFSGFLNVISGYGEQPERAFGAYISVVAIFTIIYWWLTQTIETHVFRLSWDEALVLSLITFHGRGFFPNTLALGDWVTRLGAIEAVIGLFIEVIFIATFSRRFLGD